MNCSWGDWLARLHAYQGVAYDKGFIPIRAIKYIVHLEATGEPPAEYTDNVVPLRKS